jgi:hypothetical protein
MGLMWINFIRRIFHQDLTTFIFLILFFLTIDTHSAFAQNFYKEKTPRIHTAGAGIGPSFIIADNGGRYNNLSFAINPSGALFYSKRLSSHWNIRATSGVQIIESHGEYPLRIQDFWRQQGSAIRFTGTAYYLDLMPTIQLSPFFHHMTRSKINFSGGIGIGVLGTFSKLYFNMAEDSPATKQRLLTMILPIRSTLTYKLNPYSDLSLEGTVILTLSDEIDGNVGSNQFNDNLVQLQLMYIRYLK